MSATLTDSQHLVAARRGYDVRMARAADRRELRRRTLRLSQVIADPPGHWHTAMLYDALLSVPGFGPHKLRAFNACAVRRGVNVCAPVGLLAPGQRAWVVAYLQERGL